MPANRALVEQKELSPRTVLREVSQLVARRPLALFALSLPIVLLRLVTLWLSDPVRVDKVTTTPMNAASELAFWLLTLVPSAALSFIAYGEFSGEPISLRRALGTAAKRAWRLLSARLIYSIVGLMLLLLGIVPGLIWFLRGTFWLLVVMAEPNADPFKRSAALMKGRYADYVWLVLMFGLLGVGPFIAAQELGLTTLSAVLDVLSDLFWNQGVLALLFWHARERGKLEP
jgi:hypothetical protein